MKVIGFCGWSGSGKTTLIEGVIAALKAAGLRVSVVKHAHHRFDIDHEGKDSWRHRKAGAFEVLVASSKRLALMREYEDEVEHDVHRLIAELAPVADWVLVEGFRHADLLKIEVWRQGVGEAPLYPADPYVVAVATDDAARLPSSTGLPVLPLDQPAAVAQWLMQSGSRHDYPRS
ncbi:molybdopterin-guanine dinucleotide biosynthesis protein B [Ideonella sp. BN130291]|uniref:molybdopterin-guanine dinucleotide biosynthesis protein B n=1 Tax=Ideonella sp. BN130291 TaxID=3112940 RepID=UPI002E25739D|nr:molybdopterin-guanine dinucleotide biosynthesis protein B [Ideonella sp. BN130291]